MNASAEEALRELDRDVVTLKVANAQLAVTVSSLAGQVNALESTVKELNNTMQQGRGALWGITLAAGTLGGVITAIIRKAVGV